jgi:hypothetical protein
MHLLPLRRTLWETAEMIEIARKKSRFIYRLNPWNARVIDRRLNQHNARWQAYGAFDTEQEARNTILKLEAPQTKQEGK